MVNLVMRQHRSFVLRVVLCCVESYVDSVDIHTYVGVILSVLMCDI
jgi:hypothetical protein